MKEPEKNSVENFDAMFFDFAEKLSNEIVVSAKQSVGSILSACHFAISDMAQTSLEKFQKLYFDSEELVDKKKAINDGVDDLFEKIQAEISKGGDVGAIVEDENLKNARLELASSQRKLETMLTVDHNLKQKLVPALIAMQFEENLRAAIVRIPEFWKLHQSAKNPEEFLTEVKERVSTQLELDLFNKHLASLGSETNKKAEPSWLDSLLG